MHQRARPDESAADATGAEAERDEASAARDLAELQSIFHDLQVRQAEIETERAQLRLANARLDESVSHLAELYDFAPIAYLRIDPAGRILEANLTAAALFGRERGNLIETPLSALVVPADRQALRAHIESCLGRHVRVTSELAFALRSGPPVTTQVTSAPVLDVTGAPIGCKTVLTDVSALRWSSDKLHFLNRASALLGASFDVKASLSQVARLAVPEMADACILDLRGAQGSLSRAEAAFREGANVSRLDVLRAAAPRVHDGTALSRVLGKGEPLLFADMSIAPVPGRVDHDSLVMAAAPASVMYVPIVARGTAFGVFTFIAGAARRRYTHADVTTMSELATRAAMALESARLYDEAQRAIAARQDVLSFVSHDLKNPLMGIMLTTDTILQGPPGEERRRSAPQLRRIQSAAQQMRRMIDDLLDMSALEAGRLTVTIARHRASRLLDEAVEQFAPQASARGLALDVVPPPATVEIACDRQRLAQVLTHIVDNALKFTPPQGRISLSVRVVGESAVFAVADTGPGISPSLRPRIFERFAQAKGAATLGRGLGLYIAKGLVMAQGGSIWVDSAEGVGTTFSFTVPLASS